MAVNFYEIPCENTPKKKEDIADGPTVADELNARLGLLQDRELKCKPIKPLAKAKVPKPIYSYQFQCVCSQYIPSQHAHCQHTGQIIIDRDVLTKEEHICFLATPKKELLPLSKRRPPPVYMYKRITVPACTARVERLALPHIVRVKDTLRKFKEYLPERNTKALKQQLEPRPEGAVEALTLEKALEYIEEEQRLQRVARQLHRRRCRSLRKRILQKQRKQIRKIVCVLFEELKDFLLNDQFIIDERSPLCSVILERIKDFTDQEFYTTSNLREYQRILANNLTVWINKFISNLNIHLAPTPVTQRRAMHAQQNDTFVPVSDYISVSEDEAAEDEDLYDLDESEGLYDNDNYMVLPEDYLPESIRTSETVQGQAPAAAAAPLPAAAAAAEPQVEEE